jgi:hypothetical protein
MQVLKENFAESAVVEPRTPDKKGSEPKWNEPKKSLARPSTLEGMFTYFFVVEKNHFITERLINPSKILGFHFPTTSQEGGVLNL